MGRKRHSSVLSYLTRRDGQLFIAPTIIDQTKVVIESHGLNLHSNWIFHATQSSYMDWDGWLKTIINFMDICRASLGNPQYLFFNDHDSHFNPNAINLINKSHIESLFLEVGDSKNNQTNNNGLNVSVN